MLLKTVRREDPIELNYNSLKNQKLISNKKRQVVQLGRLPSTTNEGKQNQYNDLLFNKRI